MGNRGNLHLHRGELEQALACYVQWESLARAVGNRLGAARAICNRGVVHRFRGEYERAQCCYSELETIAREIGERQSVAMALCFRGSLHLESGEYEQALACFPEAEAIARETGDRPQLISVLTELARTMLQCSSLDRMPSYLEPLLAGTGPWRLRCLDVAGRRALEALSVAKDLGVEGSIAEAEVVLGRIEAAAGDTVAARDRLLRTLASATEDNLAEPHYWLWKLDLDPAVDHHAQAEKLLARIYARSPRVDVKLKLDELRTAGATTAPSEVTNALP